MADSAHVNGLDQLQKMLDTVTPKLEQNIMRGALRSGMNQVKPIAQAKVNSVSGELARSLKVGTRARGGTVTASLKAKGKAFYARFVEYGTAAHVIAGKNGGWLNFGGVFRRSVNHPGARAKPFLRPALDSQAQAALLATGEYVRARLTKEGLDTSHVFLDGDE